EVQVRRSAEVSAGGAAAFTRSLPLPLLTAFAGGTQPAALKIAFVSSKGAATNSSTLKIRAKTIELAAAAVLPFFNSSRERFFFAIGNKAGRAPVIPAKSPSPSITAGVSATSTSAASASWASAYASLAE